MSFAKLITGKPNNILYFDNFFTSYNLLSKLRDMGIRAAGTVRDGRTGTAPLKDKKNVAKQERGTFEYTCDGKICVVMWSDNVVTYASNFDT